MSVHHEISKKVNRTVGILEGYRNLDQAREFEIEQVITKAKKGEHFTVDGINRITVTINEYAAKHHLPSRKLVTEQMILDALNTK